MSCSDGRVTLTAGLQNALDKPSLLIEYKNSTGCSLSSRTLPLCISKLAFTKMTERLVKSICFPWQGHGEYFFSLLNIRKKKHPGVERHQHVTNGPATKSLDAENPNPGKFRSRSELYNPTRNEGETEQPQLQPKTLP